MALFPDEEIKPSSALRLLLESGVPVTNITFSSDSCGSLPGFDEKGSLVKLEMGSAFIKSERTVGFCIKGENPA